jgi:thiol-disulfide isomerase/thioredoxin
MISIIAAVVAVGLAGANAPSPKLEIGQPAPPLSVGTWVKGEPIKEFRRDRVYVVEFWATWCRPCIAAMPHLSAVQQRYRDRVTVIGVSVGERQPASIAPFVEKNSANMNYAVATDDVAPGDEGGMNGKMAAGWLAAADVNGIPATFVINQGIVAWIGNPHLLDGVLESILDGTWNVQDAGHARRARLAATAKYETLRPEIAKTFKNDQVTSDSLALLERIIRDDPSAELAVARLRFQLLLEAGKFEEASQYGRRIVDTVLVDEYVELNYMAVLILNYQSTAGKGRTADLELALKAAKRATLLTRETDGLLLDRLARVHFARGEASEALAAQEKAVRLLGDTADEQAKARLETYRQAVPDRPR